MRFVYIDESGNKDIDVPKDGATDFYVVAAAIVEEADLEEFQSMAKEVSESHFGGSQIKSKNVGKDQCRRARVLADLVKLPAHFYGLAIDKRRLRAESGLRYDKSFYKYILRIAQAELLASFPELDLTIDDHGSEEFKDSFIRYMRRHFQHDLFSENDWRYSKSKNSRGVQVADFIAGSLMKTVEAQDQDGARPAFFEILRSRLTFAGPWPQKQFPYHLGSMEGEPDIRFDRQLVELGLHRARTFLAANDALRDTDSRLKVLTLNRLLSEFRGLNPRKYLSGPVLRSHLADHMPDASVTEQAFMNKVIAPLRDAGVLVVASEKGYKLPVCMADVLAHMDGTCKKVVPMIQRLTRFCDAVKLATGGDVDLFSMAEYAFLERAKE